MNDLLDVFNEHSQKIAAGISVVLIILMSLSVADTALVVLEAMNPPQVLSAGTTRSASGPNQATYKVSNLELFGRIEEARTASQEVIDAPETRLNLELQGVFIADDPDDSTAIVGEKNKAGELFRIGEKLPGNATLAAVYVDHVLLRRGGRMERLMFSDSAFRVAAPDNPAPAAAVPRNTPGITSNQRSQLEQVRNRIRNPEGREPAGNSAAANDTREQIARYREKLASDPAGTLSEFGIAPVAAGDARGYRIGNEAQGAIRQAGLQPGDVILSVNGRPVGNAANDSALVDQVMASSRVRVEVQRGERRFFLTVPVPK